MDPRIDDLVAVNENTERSANDRRNTLTRIQVEDCKERDDKGDSSKDWGDAVEGYSRARHVSGFVRRLGRNALIMSRGEKKEGRLLASGKTGFRGR